MPPPQSPADATSTPAPSTDPELAGIYEKDEETLAVLGTRKEMRKGAGLVKLVPGEVETRKVVLDVPWMGAVVEEGEEDGEGDEEVRDDGGLEGDDEDEDDDDEDADGEEDEVDEDEDELDEDEDDENDENAHPPPAAAGKRKRQRESQPTARPSKKVAFSTTTSKVRKSRPTPPSKTKIKGQSRTETSPSTNSTSKSKPKAKPKPNAVSSSAPKLTKKGANAGTKPTSASGGTADGAYDFGQFFR